jgi:hypothetical protein
VFTTRYGLYLYMYIKLIFIFKCLKSSLEFILPLCYFGERLLRAGGRHKCFSETCGCADNIKMDF